jgi:hypothetical protein
MTVIYGLIFITGLLTGVVGGWLVTSQYYERVMAEQHQDEREMVEFQELYAAWAMLHRFR